MHAKNVNINPCNMCMPMGGVLAFKGIEKSVVIIHGSQGCSTYIRRHIAEHFNEPLDVGSSSLNEKGTVYGGEKNLKTGLDNIIKVYKPKVVGVLTTCLAETIGEDIERIVESYNQERKNEKVKIIPINTPGYSGSHTEGFFVSLRKILENVVKPSQKLEKIGVIVPNISPADIRELKRILDLFKIKYMVFPDFSMTLDGPYKKEYKKISEYGTKIKDIVSMSGLKAVIEFSKTFSDDISPGEYLKEKFSVELFRLPLPTGLRNMDEFIEVLQRISGKDLPKEIVEERGRLLDSMVDSHKYNAQGKVVLYQEPESLFSTLSFLEENGIEVVVAATGSEKSKIVKIYNNKDFPLYAGADFDMIFNKIENKEVTLAIGNSDGRCLTEQKNIPLIRCGFPIHDRMGGGRIRSLGYLGTIDFLDKITNKILEEKLSNYRLEMNEKYFVPLKKRTESKGEIYE